MIFNSDANVSLKRKVGPDTMKPGKVQFPGTSLSAPERSLPPVLGVSVASAH